MSERFERHRSRGGRTRSRSCTKLAGKGMCVRAIAKALNEGRSYPVKDRAKADRLKISKLR